MKKKKRKRSESVSNEQNAKQSPQPASESVAENDTLPQIEEKTSENAVKTPTPQKAVRDSGKNDKGKPIIIDEIEVVSVSGDAPTESEKNEEKTAPELPENYYKPPKIRPRKEKKPVKPIKHFDIRIKKISYERKKQLYGYGFISLWLIGTIWLFVIPIIQSIVFSFKDAMVYNKERAWEAGYLGAGVDGKWVGFSNYVTAFTGDKNFPQALLSSIGEIIPKALVIMIFSLFIAVILNQKFRGRTLARAIFFLPVLIATGPVISVINGDIANQGVTSAAQFSTLFRTDLVGSLLEFVGIYRLSPAFVTFIETITSNVLNLVWNSGIQILIFLSALQNIPRSAKEAADIEGATAWEFFWKITFPLISPMILANLMYTIIDAFVSTDNKVMSLVLSYSRNGSLGYSAALAWIYFAIIGVILAITALVCSRFVYYEIE